MPTGYLVVNGVEVTRREYLAWEKEQLDMPMDHFDKRALKRYYEKMKKKDFLKKAKSLSYINLPEYEEK